MDMRAIDGPAPPMRQQLAHGSVPYTVFKSPLGDFLAAVRRAGLESKVTVLRHGQTHGFKVRAAGR